MERARGREELERIAGDDAGAAHVARSRAGGAGRRRSRARPRGGGRRGLPRDRGADARRGRCAHAGGEGARRGGRSGARRRSSTSCSRSRGARRTRGSARCRSGSWMQETKRAARRVPRRQEPHAARPVGPGGAGARSRARGRRELTPRIGREVLRQRAIGACVLRDSGTLSAVKEAVLSPTSPFAGSSGGRRDSLLRLLARCEERLARVSGRGLRVREPRDPGSN